MEQTEPRLEGHKLENEDVMVRLVDGNRVILATAQLCYIQTSTRTAFLLEEVFVPEGLRGNGYAKMLCEKVIEWVRDYTAVDRIELSCNESATKLFKLYISAGFLDRKQKSFFWVRDWKEPE